MTELSQHCCSLRVKLQRLQTNMQTTKMFAIVQMALGSFQHPQYHEVLFQMSDVHVGKQGDQYPVNCSSPSTGNCLEQQQLLMDAHRRLFGMVALDAWQTIS